MKKLLTLKNREGFMKVGKTASAQKFTAMVTIAALAMIFSGCMTMQQMPSEKAVRGMRSLAVVAIEAPPLLVHPKTAADQNAILSAGLTPPGGGLPVDPRYSLALPLFGYIGTLIVSSFPMSGETASMVKESPPWMPTTGLAKAAAQKLQQGGNRETSVIEGYARLPISDRSVNVYLENWMAAERRWYNSDAPMLDYGQLGMSRVDAILEVGVLNYEYFFDRLLLQVITKLIDPATKRVIGKARCSERPRGENLASMLQDKGQPMQRLIETTGDALLTQCMKDLGLIPR